MSDRDDAIRQFNGFLKTGQALIAENELLIRENERLRRFEVWAQKFIETAKYGLPPQGTWQRPSGEEITRDEFCDEIARELIKLFREDGQS